jgi:hypothetical protein
MLRTFFEPVMLNQMLNGLLLMFIGIFFWAWLVDYGVPANILLGIGALTLVFDIRDYSRKPRPRSLLIGGIVLPMWPLLRFWTR